MVLRSNPQFSKSVFSSLLGLMLVFASAGAWAQMSGEALWRVENEKPSEPAPLYEGQTSPFPITLPPVTVKETPIEVPKLSPQEQAAEKQARETASRMSRIRDLLKDAEAFIPDTSGITIKAIAKGQQGRMALIKGQWLFEGDTIEAPVTTANELVQLLAGLEQMDTNFIRTTIIINRKLNPTRIRICHIY